MKILKNLSSRGKQNIPNFTAKVIKRRMSTTQEGRLGKIKAWCEKEKSYPETSR